MRRLQLSSNYELGAVVIRFLQLAWDTSGKTRVVGTCSVDRIFYSNVKTCDTFIEYKTG